jgi:hypothetical protein
MRKNSVLVGEIGMRYVAAINMVSPMNDWGKALKEGRAPVLQKSELRRYVGLGSIAGKTLASTSLVPDPYNPQPKSKFAQLREKYSFLVGGIIEAGAFSALIGDALKNSKPTDRTLNTNMRSIKFGKTYHRDWLSATGAAMFVTGYIVRSWAKFGERHVDMNELYAHVSDTIAMLPHDKIPQALADISADLAQHFQKDPKINFATVYNKINDDLCKEHHISVATSMPTNSEQTIAVATDNAIGPSSVLPATQIQAGNTQHIAPIAHEQQATHAVAG